MPNQPTSYNSIPKENFDIAAKEYFRNMGIGMQVDRRNTIQVYEIAKDGHYDFHLSAIYTPSGADVIKFHFTLRKGPGKGNDAFAWFEIVGHNKAARLLPRKNQGNIALLADTHLPAAIRHHVNQIDKYAQEIFTKAVQYTMPMRAR